MGKKELKKEESNHTACVHPRVKGGGRKKSSRAMRVYR